MISFQKFTEHHVPKIDKHLSFQINSIEAPSILKEAMNYSVAAGGKRVRPLFLLAVLDILKVEHCEALTVGSIIEMVHTYSLIHDDLPAMDNDDTRRGKPTCHKQFDEATAILAGDTLNSLSFQLLSMMDANDPNLLRDSIQILHQGAGMTGMILGQMEDIEEEKNPSSNARESKLESIHEKKTGALITSSFLLGNRLRADWKEREFVLTRYAKEIGLLFQITDDILDVEGNLAELGKTPGKDAKAGKLTYPSLYGLEKSKLLRDQTLGKAISLAAELPSLHNEFFLGLPKYIAERKN